MIFVEEKILKRKSQWDKRIKYPCEHNRTHIEKGCYSNKKQMQELEENNNNGVIFEDKKC